MTATKTKVAIGRIVHFHDGVSRCRAAIVSDVQADDRADLAVLLQPRDLDNQPADSTTRAVLPCREVPYYAGDVRGIKAPTWHWPDDDEAIEAAIGGQS
jgi:hypothetical protein